MNAKHLLAQGIQRTKEIAGDYWASVLDQRYEYGSKRAGSFFTGFSSKDQIQEHLLMLPEVNIELYEGSPEEGRVIIRVKGLFGKEGVVEKEKVAEENLFFDNPKNIPGREEYCSYIENDDQLPDTTEAYIPILYTNPETKEINVNEPFVPTILVGRYLGPDDTVKGVGSFVKLVLK